MGITVVTPWWNVRQWKLGPRRYQGVHFVEQWYHFGPFALVIEVAE